MADKIKFTIRQVLDIASGLKRLDGIVKGRENEPFEFSPKVSWNIAKNGSIFEREVESFSKAQRALAAASNIYEGDTLSPGNASRFAAYKDKVEAMKDETVEVSGVLTLKLSELTNRPSNTLSKIKTNPIPPTTLIQIMAIIEEDTELT